MGNGAIDQMQQASRLHRLIGSPSEMAAQKSSLLLRLGFPHSETDASGPGDRPSPRLLTAARAKRSRNLDHQLPPAIVLPPHSV